MGGGTQAGGRRLNGRAVEIVCSPDEKMAHLARVDAVRHLVEDVEIVPPDLDELYRYFSTGEDARS